MTADVLIVGGGILAASVALHLKARGAGVVVLADAPGGVATTGSFAWINAAAPCEPAYSALRLDGIRRWRELASRAPGLPVRLAGGLHWDIAAADRDAAAADFAARGYPVREVARGEIRSLEPALGAPPDRAFLAEAEGVADPARIAAALFDAAGVAVRTCRVTGLRAAGGRIAGVATDAGPVDAGRVVLAAGTGTAALLAPLGIPLPVAGVPGLLLRTAPLPPLTRRVLCAPGIHLWQMDDGCVLAAEDYAGSDPGEADRTVAALLGRIAALFPAARGVREAGRSVVERPMPRDDRPVAGAVAGCDGLFVAVTHSGVTLAPVLGDLLAGEVLGGDPAAALAPFRPGRFAP